MFDSITGQLVRKDPAGVVLSAGGIGYWLSLPQRTLTKLPETKLPETNSPGEGQLTLYTHLVIKDDSIRLFGFQSPQERDLFLKIVGVSGIGAATALALLSEFPPARFVAAVSQEKVTLLQSIKGIGVRTAKRLVLELKGKVAWAGTEPGEGGLGAEDEESEGTQISSDLVAALVSLGYPRPSAQIAARKAQAVHPDTDHLETLLKAALRSM